ncbi:hypothetical protein H4R33_001724 [Dimargaris cristalligena]|uniref:Transmembrane protein n=1 Tax=Dimargaris cristalligena TaxID=215637 RepID=A0A4P9ZSU6_9FUNG|nr:hypothetical protein H4R33_001724 [Dimargaris cristalligena]RKP36268.1 hypothetical protein BJ085DRAFT_32717 [Dimargaris cristalligena]|eukprot:RKP36268.1 hypothetical protein BJ085DRAFT_32717 [Dimargaris cristalligena]
MSEFVQIFARNNTASPDMVIYTMSRDWYAWRNAKLIILPMATAMFLSNFINTIWLIRKTFKLYRLQQTEKTARRLSAAIVPASATASSAMTATNLDNQSINTTNILASSRYPSGYSSAYQSAGPVSQPSRGSQQFTTTNTSTLASQFNEVVPFPPTKATSAIHWVFLAQSAFSFVAILLQLVNYYAVDKACEGSGTLATAAYFVATSILALCTGIIIASGEQSRIGSLVNYGLIPVAIGLRVFALLNSLSHRYTTWEPLCEFDVHQTGVMTAALVDLVIWLAQTAMVMESALFFRNLHTTPLRRIFRTGNAGCLLAACVAGVLVSLITLIQGGAGTYSIFPCWFIVWAVSSKLILESFAEGLKSCLQIYSAGISQGVSDLGSSQNGGGGGTSNKYGAGSRGFTTTDGSALVTTDEGSHVKTDSRLSRLSSSLRQPEEAMGKNVYSDEELNGGIPMDRLPIYKPSQAYEQNVGHFGDIVNKDEKTRSPYDIEMGTEMDLPGVNEKRRLSFS